MPHTRIGIRSVLLLRKDSQYWIEIPDLHVLSLWLFGGQRKPSSGYLGKAFEKFGLPGINYKRKVILLSPGKPGRLEIQDDKSRTPELGSD